MSGSTWPAAARLGRPAGGSPRARARAAPAGAPQDGTRPGRRRRPARAVRPARRAPPPRSPPPARRHHRRARRRELVLAGNQYRTVCLRTPTSAAISSSEAASTPRVPNRSSAASRIAVAGAAIDVHGHHVSLPFGRDVLDMCAVIADSLAGKRIAITGATGFVGTALVERLLRCVPDCELVLLVRGGKRTTAAERVATGDPQERRLRPVARRARRPSVRGDDRPADHHDQRRRRHRRPRADDDRSGLLASCDVVIHSAARCRSTRRSTRPSRSTSSARRASPTCSTSSASTPHLVAVSTCYVAGNRRGTAPRSSSARDRSTSASTGAPRSPPPAACAATPRPRAATRPARRVPRRGAHASSAPPARRRSPPRPSSSASGGSRTSSSRPAGPEPRASAGPTPTRSPRRSASRR